MEAADKERNKAALAVLLVLDRRYKHNLVLEQSQVGKGYLNQICTKGLVVNPVDVVAVMLPGPLLVLSLLALMFLVLVLVLLVSC